MSGQPWGRTGRVTLNPLYPGVLTEVRVGDELVGHVYDDDLSAWDRHRWKFSPPMPTADHAVMWVLRRAAPDVWRAERPVVYRIWRDTERLPVDVVWLSASPGSAVSWNYTWESAMASAERRARIEYARTAS